VADRLNIPPPSRVALGFVAVGGQRVQVFIDPEWARYLESLNNQVNVTTSAVGLPGAPGATGAAGSSVSFGGGDSESVEFIPGPKGDQGVQGAIGPALGLFGGDDAQVEFIQGPIGPQGEQGPSGAVVALMFDLDEVTELPLSRPVNGGNPVTDDQFSEGTWTPVLTFATPGNLSVTYSRQVGLFKRVGNMIHAWFEITTSAFTHTTASGNVNITGLSTSNNATVLTTGEIQWSGITKAGYTDMKLNLNTSTNVLTIRADGSGVSQTALTTTDLPTGGTYILNGYICYAV
jgi:hypothetical protein